MKSFQYTGKQPLNISIRRKTDDNKIIVSDVRLGTGDIANLDENNAIVKTFVTQGLLTDAPTPVSNIKESSKK